MATHFQFQPDFLQGVAASAHVSYGLLERRARQEVALEEPLEALPDPSKRHLTNLQDNGYRRK